MSIDRDIFKESTTRDRVKMAHGQMAKISTTP